MLAYFGSVFITSLVFAFARQDVEIWHSWRFWTALLVSVMYGFLCCGIVSQCVSQPTSHSAELSPRARKIVRMVAFALPIPLMVLFTQSLNTNPELDQSTEPFKVYVHRNVETNLLCFLDKQKRWLFPGACVDIVVRSDGTTVAQLVNYDGALILSPVELRSLRDAFRNLPSFEPILDSGVDFIKIHLHKDSDSILSISANTYPPNRRTVSFKISHYGFVP